MSEIPFSRSFIRHSGIAALVVITLMLNGSQNTAGYWQAWNSKRENWQVNQWPNCQNTKHYQQYDQQQYDQQQCRQQWRQLLTAAMDYNREVNAMPGWLWRAWLYPDLPRCVRIPAQITPAQAQLSAATVLRPCPRDQRQDS
ncbi:hypothetical protein [Candidatus Thalassolituus haligoni]|uniref:hypothetical protein n=1 Tax=Candidatus Thalassolituus haligoni TaxID=3100113 RepID=UPI003514972B|tara:strand:+ start:28313 stop:28738 length:426 start_codon:yes stop_codon:yes gene_type:complete